jgi:hypothetical protein
MASQGWDFSLGVRPIMPTSLDSLDSLAAALRSNREMEMRQAQFDAEQKEREKSRLAFEDQNKIGNRRADLAEERDQRKFELDTAHLRGEALKEAQRQYLTGGLPAVQAYVASQRIRNREGKWEGMGLDIRRDYANVAPDLQQPMQAPKPLSSGLRLDYENAPAELPADGQPEMTFAGPRAGMDRFYDRKTTFQPPSPEPPPLRTDLPPEDAQKPPGIYGMLNGAPKAPPPGLAGMMKLRAPEPMSAAPAPLPGAQGEEYGLLTLQDGTQVRLDQKFKENAARQRAEEQAARIRSILDDPSKVAALTPIELARYQKAAVDLEMQLSGQAIASADSLVLQKNKQDWDKEEALRSKMTAEQQYRIGMRPRSSGMGGGGNYLGELNTAKKEQEILKNSGILAQQATAPLKDLFRNKGFIEERKEERMFDRARDMNDGADLLPAAATMLRGWFARAGAGVGVLTDRDIDNFYNNIGGLLQKWGLKLNDLKEGTIDAQKKADLEAVFKIMKAHSDEYHYNLGADIVTEAAPTINLFGGDTEAWKFAIGSKLKTYTPQYLKTFEEDYGPVNWRLYRDSQANRKTKTGVGANAGLPSKPTAPAAPAVAPKKLTPQEIDALAGSIISGGGK